MTSMHGVPFEKYESIRFGLIGAGERGRMLLRELLALDSVEIIAITDISEASIQKAVDLVTQNGKSAPKTWVGETDWQQLLEEDLDLVYVATPWDTHARYAVAAMKAGKHVGVEVPAALTIDECWQLVETSEQTRKHCIMLENCCYDYWETIAMRMAAAGEFGTLTHAEAAYIHDLREMLLSDRSEGLWRRYPHLNYNGNHYPTHGLGPVAQILGIGDTDEFDYLVSMSSLPVGLSDYRTENLPSDDPKQQEVYTCGDMNTSLIRTKLGRTIVLQHSVVTPRPYDRNFLISGTSGTFRGNPARLYLDGITPHEEWEPTENYQRQWEHPLWTEYGDLARSRGHGGMDFIMNLRLIQLMKDGLPPDMDVYDAADWSAPGPLSAESVANGSMPVKFPDFRRNRES
ncbi:MAG: Gfo/Idh/MocA family oxidoreductase [Anaerolineaceae bacterium]|nr:Gfo/Idh/MocA family oxidoreductase [Anaerolineaceae bacterium]